MIQQMSEPKKKKRTGEDTDDKIQAAFERCRRAKNEEENREILNKQCGQANNFKVFHKFVRIKLSIKEQIIR